MFVLFVWMVVVCLVAELLLVNGWFVVDVGWIVG